MFEIATMDGKFFISEEVISGGEESKAETISVFIMFTRCLTKALSKDGNKIIVDWEEIEKAVQCADWQKRPEIRNCVYLVLMDLKILTKNPKNAYSFSNLGLNPDWGVFGDDCHVSLIGPLYFKRKEDIIAYAKSRWSKAINTGDWNIFRMTELVNRQEICR